MQIERMEAEKPAQDSLEINKINCGNLLLKLKY